MWICTPRGRTRQDFTDTIGRFLAAAAGGSWDDIHLDGAEDAAVPGRWLHAWQAGRPILAGSAPLVAALALVEAGILTGALVTPVLLFSGSLAFIVLLHLIDPQLIERIGSAKEIASTFLTKK
jgi:hypothetical protein